MAETLVPLRSARIGVRWDADALSLDFLVQTDVDAALCLGRELKWRDEHILDEMGDQTVCNGVANACCVANPACERPLLQNVRQFEELGLVRVGCQLVPVQNVLRAASLLIWVVKIDTPDGQNRVGVVFSDVQAENQRPVVVFLPELHARFALLVQNGVNAGSVMNKPRSKMNSRQ